MDYFKYDELTPEIENIFSPRSDEDHPLNILTYDDFFNLPVNDKYKKEALQYTNERFKNISSNNIAVKESPNE